MNPKNCKLSCKYVNKKIPGGWLAMRFGGRLVMFFAMLIPSILTLITPVIANLDSPAALIVLRFFIGLIHVKKASKISPRK